VRSRYVNATRRGGPGVLELRDREVAVHPPAGEALVRVVAAGVSYGDILLRVGVIPGGPKPPFTPGFEIAGIVEAVGEGVTGVREGQAVVGLVRSGGYTDLLSVPAARLIPVPDGVALTSAAAVALNYFIAYQMLHRVAMVSAGQHVLVHGAGGGVGTAFLQLAALDNLRVHATASAAKHDLIRELGGHPIDYRAEDFVAVTRERTGGKGVAAAFDPVGGGHFRASYRTLGDGGTLVAFGQSAAFADGKARMRTGAWGMLGGIVAPKLIPDGKTAVFYNAWSLEKKEPLAYREDLGTIMSLLEGGQIEPVMAETLPLDDAAKAHELLESGVIRGKIVLTCAPEAGSEARADARRGSSPRRGTPAS
jgi:NADPH:quinone reductase-like Zn-dependent oxidoreductase